MVKTRRRNYESSIMNTDKRTRTTANTTSDDEDSSHAISARTLNQIFKHNNRYANSPRNSMQYEVESATWSLALTRRPTSTRFGSLKFITPCGGYTTRVLEAQRNFEEFSASRNEIDNPDATIDHKFDSLITANYGSAESTLQDEHIREEFRNPNRSILDRQNQQKVEFEINEGLVTIGYHKSEAVPGHFIPTRVTLDEFTWRFGGKSNDTEVKRKVKFVNEWAEDKNWGETEDTLHIDSKDDEFERKLQEIATKNENKHNDCKRNDGKEVLTRRRQLIPIEEMNYDYGGMKGNTIRSAVEHRLAIICNILHLQQMEHLTGSENYDGWATKI